MTAMRRRSDPLVAPRSAVTRTSNPAASAAAISPPFRNPPMEVVERTSWLRQEMAEPSGNILIKQDEAHADVLIKRARDIGVTVVTSSSNGTPNGV